MNNEFLSEHDLDKIFGGVKFNCKLMSRNDAEEVARKIGLGMGIYATIKMSPEEFLQYWENENKLDF